MFLKISRVLETLFRRGFFHTTYLLYLYLVLPGFVAMSPFILVIYKKIKLKMDKHLFSYYSIRKWRNRKHKILEVGRFGYLLKLEELGLSVEQIDVIQQRQALSREVVVAEIDQDGLLLSNFGPINNLSMVSEKDFLIRKKFRLYVVILESHVGIKKNYRGDRLAFLKELSALHRLGIAGCNVPAVMDVDFDNLTLTYSFILGAVLREKLAIHGAVLRDKDVEDNSEFTILCSNKKWLKRIHEGKKFLYDVVNSNQVNDLFEQLRKVHKAGFIWNDLKYGNVVIEEKTGNLYLIDFDVADYYTKLPKLLLRVLKDQEIELFNLHFDTQEMTYNKLKKEIDSIRKGPVYAPVYFCAGLKLGNLWINSVGYGRWHYMLRKSLPPLSGKRILDLGANNAFNSLHMLRSGAKEVIGIELSEDNIKQGELVKKGIEWADNKRYNFRYINENMKEIVNMNLGRFDIVLALCCIYYLDDDSISNLIQFISTITEVFVVQCNLEKNIDRSVSYTYEKASIEYNMKMLKDNGFPCIKVIAPYNYSRPLLIAKKTE